MSNHVKSHKAGNLSTERLIRISIFATVVVFGKQLATRNKQILPTQLQDVSGNMQPPNGCIGAIRIGLRSGK